MTMFDGLTMVSYDGHNRNKMMVDHVWTMVDHGRPWSGGQMFAGADIKHQIYCTFSALSKITEAKKLAIIVSHYNSELEKPQKTLPSFFQIYCMES